MKFYHLKKIWKTIPILDPTNKFKLIWDFGILLLIFTNLFYLSLELTFEPDFNKFYDKLYNCFTISALSIDILIKFKTSYYDHGIVMKNHYKISRNYYQNEFMIDVFAVIALILHISFSAHTYYKWVVILFLGKLKCIKTIIRNYENIVDFGDFYELFGVMLKVLCVARILACFWHYIAFCETDKITWLTVHNLQNADWSVKYIYSIYWALVTMVTVGYGDITPQNPSEIIYCSFTILAGSMVFGYCLNRIGSLLTNIDERDKELKF